MRSIPILIVSVGLFLACTSKPERPRLEPPVVLSCQESCGANGDCPNGVCCLDADACGEANRCVECAANGDCADGSLCHEGSCVGCLADKDCSGETSVCNVPQESGAPLRAGAALYSCVQCGDDAQCSGGQICSTTGSCKCGEDKQCTEAGLKLCRNEGCVCSDDSGCPDGAQKCIAGICVACAEDDQCAEGQKCFSPDSKTAYCGCTSNDQCADGKLCNVDNGKCVTCLQDSNCADSTSGKVCNTTNGSCVQCTDAKQCGGKDQKCTDNVCTCAAASDCKAEAATADLKWVCE